MPGMTRRRPQPWGEVAHPRALLPGESTGFHFGNLPERHQEAAMESMTNLGGERADVVRLTVAANLAQASSKLAESEAKGERPGPKAHANIARLKQAVVESGSLPPTGMEASVGRIKETAMMPVKAARQHARTTGLMEAPPAGEFYGEHHKIHKKIGEKVFGKGSEEAYRYRIAAPGMSARMAPQKEVNAGVGLANVLAGGEEIGLHIPQGAARYLSEQMRGAGNFPDISAGPTSFGHLARTNAPAAAMLLQYGANQSGIVVPSTKETEWTSAKQQQMQALHGTQVHIPAGMEQHVESFVSGYGITGWPKGGRALGRFHAPLGEFGDFDFHKIPSYTWNSMQADEAMSKGTHHFLGALTHGTAWFDQHPDAEHHIRKAMAHPAWDDPTNTVDVWSGRVASGLPYNVARGLGESTNPEHIMTLAGAPTMKGVPQMGDTKRRPLGKKSDLGYLYAEEAHRRAGQGMSIRLPSGGRAHMPGHVAQSLSWFGSQAEEYPEKIRTGERVLHPSSMRDPRSLNSLVMPRF